MRHCRKKAFTLVEILAVIMIAGIMSALALPLISPTADLRVASGARSILADINYAQSLAISKQKKVYIVFTDSEYTIKSRDSDSDALATINHPVTKERYVNSFNTGSFDTVYLGTAQFGSVSTLSFDETGTPMSWNEATNTNTTLTSIGVIRILSGSSVMSIKVEPYTGEVSISED